MSQCVTLYFFTCRHPQICWFQDEASVVKDVVSSKSHFSCLSTVSPVNINSCNLPDCVSDDFTSPKRQITQHPAMCCFIFEVLNNSQKQMKVFYTIQQENKCIRPELWSNRDQGALLQQIQQVGGSWKLFRQVLHVWRHILTARCSVAVRKQHYFYLPFIWI